MLNEVIVTSQKIWHSVSQYRNHKKC